MKIEELITYIKTNFPNGCEDVACKTCTIYHAKPSTPEDLLCDLLSALTEDYNNWEKQS